MVNSDGSATPLIPGYQIARLLRHGGMADVYLGTQISLARPVAIKVLAADRTLGEETVARFEHEARTIARLDHPHIVSIFDVGTTGDGRMYYTMPYLPRGDLDERRPDEAGVVTILRALCSALGYAHDHGIVHRDVKPGNILFDQRDRPLLADFGIALTTRDVARVTREGLTIGSGGYMSPEQARGLPLDGRADLYSLGVVAYELLSGDLPFHGQDTLSMALAHVEEPVPRLATQRRRWQAFIDKAMAKNPGDRFASASEMAAALDSIEAHLENRAGPLPVSPVVHSWLAPIGASALIVMGISMLSYALWRGDARVPVAETQVVAAAPEKFASSAPATDASQAAMPMLSSAASSDLASNDSPTPTKVLSPAARVVDSSNDSVKAGASAAISGEAREEGIALASTTAPSTTANVAPAMPRGVTVDHAAMPATATSIDAAAKTPAAGTTIRDRQGPALAFVPAKIDGPVQGFAMSQHEVTRGEYAAFVAATGRRNSACREPLQPLSRLKKLTWRDPGFVQDDRHPVVCVTWRDADAYVRWLSQITHAEYRLPTRAEWTQAARSTPASDNACAQGNLAGHRALPFLQRRGCEGPFSQTAPVGQFKPNAFGIFDLVGNVSEWTADCTRGGGDAKGRCNEHLYTGTSWRDNTGAKNLEAGGEADDDVGYTTVGIRVVRKVESSRLPASTRR